MYFPTDTFYFFIYKNVTRPFGQKVQSPQKVLSDFLRGKLVSHKTMPSCLQERENLDYVVGLSSIVPSSSQASVFAQEDIYKNIHYLQSSVIYRRET